MRKLNKKGFTIVELVIVIAVIAILAAVLIPTFSGIVDKSKKSARMQEARNSYVEYVAAHPTAEIDKVALEEEGATYYYDIADDYAEETATESGDTVLTAGKCLKKYCETSSETQTECDECGWEIETESKEST